MDPPAIQVSWREDAFIFYVESTGALPIERIIFEALKIYEEKFSEFINQLEGLFNEPKKS